MNKIIPKLNFSSVQAFAAIISGLDSSTLAFLKKNDPSYSHLDWNSAQEWSDIISEIKDPNDIKYICKVFCKKFVLSNSILLSLAINGRDALISNLSEDEIQVFRNAELLDSLPKNDAIMWWDELKILSKRNLNESLLIQGRLAETWTIENEITILKEFTDLLPKWVAIDSDRYGYDIISYRLNDQGKIMPIQIEVKSYLSCNYPHFYLTKNEWNKSLLAMNSYRFYIWCIETKKYFTLSVNDLTEHIPTNNRRGTWQTVLIENVFAN